MTATTYQIGIESTDGEWHPYSDEVFESFESAERAFDYCVDALDDGARNALFMALEIRKVILEK